MEWDQPMKDHVKTMAIGYSTHNRDKIQPNQFPKYNRGKNKYQEKLKKLTELSVSYKVFHLSVLVKKRQLTSALPHTCYRQPE